MTTNNKNELADRFNLESKMDDSLQKVDKQAQELNKQKILRYLRSTPKFENMMQKERELININEMGTTMKSLIDADPNLRKLVYDKKTGIPDHLIKHTETLAKRRVVNTIARKSLGPFKYAFITGKLGVDTFFLIFAAVGMFAIPTYFFFKNYKVRNSLKKINEKYKLQGDAGEIDLDDMSYDFTNMRIDEIRREQLKQAKLYSQIDELEKELYGSKYVK